VCTPVATYLNYNENRSDQDWNGISGMHLLSNRCLNSISSFLLVPPSVHNRSARLLLGNTHCFPSLVGREFFLETLNTSRFECNVVLGVDEVEEVQVGAARVPGGGPGRDL
jgi:hypothetical protein